MRISSVLAKDQERILCLPAHGRGLGLPPRLRQLLKKRAGIWDLPEIPELGGPLEPNGAVAHSQERFASELGVKRCWF